MIKILYKGFVYLVTEATKIDQANIHVAQNSKILFYILWQYKLTNNQGTIRLVFFETLKQNSAAVFIFRTAT